MRKYIKKNVGKLRSKLSSSQSHSSVPSMSAHHTGLRHNPEPAKEAPSDPDIAPNAQSVPTASNISPSLPTQPPARFEEVEKDVSSSGVTTRDVVKGVMISALRVIKEASGALPPLQAAVGALIPIVEIIQVCRLFGIALSAAQ